MLFITVYYHVLCYVIKNLFTTKALVNFYLNFFFISFNHLLLQAREIQRRSSFTTTECDKCIKDGIYLSKVLSDINVDIRSSNEILEKKLKNETNAWMKGLKERVLKGKEVFRGTYVRSVCALVIVTSA
jgi:hypothetical protein